MKKRIFRPFSCVLSSFEISNQRPVIVSHQIFLISLRPTFQDDDTVREELAETVLRYGGFILMAVGAGGLIAAFDDQWAPFFQQHKAVEACGGLSLDPNGRAADKLRQLFAANVAAQLASCEPTDLAAQDTPPRHRPLTWHGSTAMHPADASGVSISLQPHSRGLS